MRHLSGISWLLGASIVALACGDSGGDPLVARGKVVYETHCTACHARDPNLDGPVGPANAGASLELLQAKVLRNEYPQGYTPKRDTQAMIVLPHLEPELPALAAYLADALKP
jgi:mono/diheme cytochrome c family protein